MNFVIFLVVLFVTSVLSQTTLDRKVQVNEKFTIALSRVKSGNWTILIKPRLVRLDQVANVVGDNFLNGTANYQQHFIFTALSVGSEQITFIERSNFRILRTTRLNLKVTPISPPTSIRNQSSKENEKFTVILNQGSSTNWTMISKPKFANLIQMAVLVQDNFITGVANYQQHFFFVASKIGQEKIIFHELNGKNIASIVELNLNVISNLNVTYSKIETRLDSKYSISFDLTGKSDTRYVLEGSSKYSKLIGDYIILPIGFGDRPIVYTQHIEFIAKFPARETLTFKQINVRNKNQTLSLHKVDVSIIGKIRPIGNMNSLQSESESQSSSALINSFNLMLSLFFIMIINF